MQVAHTARLFVFPIVYFLQILTFCFDSGFSSHAKSASSCRIAEAAAVARSDERMDGR